MADYSAVTQSGPKTLVAATVDTVTFPADCNQIEVYGSAALTFTVDGTTPAVSANSAYDLPAAGARVVNVPTAGNTVVKLISSGTPTYNVTKLS